MRKITRIFGMNRITRIISVTCIPAILVILQACLVIDSEPDDSLLSLITSSHYALVHGTIIDGRGGTPIQDGAILVKGQTISAVGPIGEVSIPSDATIIDLHGATILPGLINAHVHKAFDESRLRTWAWNGVTTVRDEGIFSPLTLDQAIAIRDSTRKKPECARLVSAGFMMTVPGGYGGMTVTSPADARRKVFEQLDKGIDLIKFSQEDGYAGKQNLPKLSTEEMSAIISAAHERGTLVSGHITQSRYWEIVARAGVDDVAHVACDPVNENILDIMIAKKIYLVPTFTVYRNYNAPVNICIDNLRWFVQKGGMVALGNDFGGGPGEFENGIPMVELNCMLEAGMSPLQIIVASTRNAAHVLNLGASIGTLEAGKRADILVVKGDPLQDLNALKNIRLVIHNGINIRAEK